MNQRDSPGVLGGPANIRPLWTQAVASSQRFVTWTKHSHVRSGSLFIWFLAPRAKDYLCRGRSWLSLGFIVGLLIMSISLLQDGGDSLGPAGPVPGAPSLLPCQIPQSPVDKISSFCFPKAQASNSYPAPASLNLGGDRAGLQGLGAQSPQRDASQAEENLRGALSPEFLVPLCRAFTPLPTLRSPITLHRVTILKVDARLPAHQWAGRRKGRGSQACTQPEKSRLAWMLGPVF